MLEKNLGFKQIIKQRAQEAAKLITSLDILDDNDVLSEMIDDPSSARKLAKIINSSAIFKLGIKKESIINFTKHTPELIGKFKYSEDGNKIKLSTNKSKAEFLKLLNDSFLRSELTKQYYDVSAKNNITQDSTKLN